MGLSFVPVTILGLAGVAPRRRRRRFRADQHQPSDRRRDRNRRCRARSRQQRPTRYSDAPVASLAALDHGYQTALAVLTGLLLLGAAVAALFVRTADIVDEQTSALPEPALLDEAA